MSFGKFDRINEFYDYFTARDLGENREIRMHYARDCREARMQTEISRSASSEVNREMTIRAGDFVLTCVASFEL